MIILAVILIAVIAAIATAIAITNGDDDEDSVGLVAKGNSLASEARKSPDECKKTKFEYFNKETGQCALCTGDTIYNWDLE